MGYRLNCLDEPVFMAVPKPMLTEFGIHYRLESCGVIQQPVYNSNSTELCEYYQNRLFNFAQHQLMDLPDSLVQEKTLQFRRESLKFYGGKLQF